MYVQAARCARRLGGMPPETSSPTPPPAPTAPLYRRLAAVLADRILDGTYEPGSDFPSEAEIDEAAPELIGVNVARSVVRDAIGQLVDDKLLDPPRQGRRTRVRRRRAVVRHLLAYLDEYAEAKAGMPEDGRGRFEAATHTRGEVQATVDYQVMAADAELAARMRTAPGTRLLRRQYLFSLDGRRYQVTHSYLPYQLVAGTRFEDPANEHPGQGTPRQLLALGVDPAWGEMAVEYRAATAAEAQLLDLPPGEAVCARREHQYLADGTVVETSDTVSPADGLTLTVRYPLGGAVPDDAEVAG